VETVALTRSQRRRLRAYKHKIERVRGYASEAAEGGGYDPRLLPLRREDKIRLVNRILEKKRERALRDFYYFAKYVYGNKDMTRRTHGELTSFITGKSKRKLILLPRGTFKSTVVTEAWVLWRLLRDPNMRVLIDNEEHSKAKAFLKAIRNCIEHNHKFRRLFGKLDANKNKDTWTDSALNFATRTVRTREPNISVAGIDSTKTGMHYDLIVCDDLVSDKNITTDNLIRKTREHYRLLLSLLDPGKELVVIGTRWHFGDLYGHLISSDEVLLRKGKRPQWKKLIRQSWEWKNGRRVLFFPERLTWRRLKLLRREQGSYIFSCQYMNDPTGGEDAPFKVEWVRFYNGDPPGIKRDGDEVKFDVPYEFSVTLDPSVGRTRDSDFCGLTIRAIDPLRNRYYVRIQRGRWNPTKTLRKLAEAVEWVRETYGVDPRVGLETTAFQYVLKHNLKQKQKDGKLPRFYVHELKADTSTTKNMRIKGALVAPFEDGQVFLRGYSLDDCTPGAKLLISEMLQFPAGATDDVLDSAAYHEQLSRLPKKRKEKPREPSRYEKNLEDAKRRGKARLGSDVVGAGRFV
jgi:phage terminase large subunit-like protein